MWHPKRQPSGTRRVPTADGHHTLFVCEYGDKTRSRASVVYLHGGPGGGSPPDIARLFDPETYHLVVFDQRGCGKSECGDRLLANTLDLLVADVETVREAIGVTEWGVMGSSYGSLLAALYAARHAAHVSWALLHGVFLGSRAEVSWLYAEGGASRFYPQQWDEMSAFITARPGDTEAATAATGASGASTAPAAAASGAAAGAAEAPPPDPSMSGGAAAGAAAGAPLPILQGYHAILTSHADLKPSLRANPLPADGETADGPPPPDVVAAAAALVRYEDEMETLAPMPATHEAGELIAGAQIAVHHFMHGCFLPEDGCVPELEAEAAQAALATVPCRIIHGRHDVVCTPRAAFRAQALWPRSRLHVVEGGAHALFEKPMRAAALACLAELVSWPSSAATSTAPDPEGGEGGGGGGGAGGVGTSSRGAAPGKRRRA
jgi:pimeloyl-ACP methyl ester carboxylesterase